MFTDSRYAHTEKSAKVPKCQNADIANADINIGMPLEHRLTLPKGVYSFRYFLSPMRIPNLLMPNPFVH